MKGNKNIIALFTAPHRIDLIESSISTLRNDYVLVEYIYCGICGGDYSVYCGNRQSYPISLELRLLYLPQPVSIRRSQTG